MIRNASMVLAPQRWLVAWFAYTLNGGLNRFTELAKVLAGWGHRVEFLSLTNETSTAWPDFPSPVRTWEQVAGERFDAVMVPGAGVDDERLARLAWLRDPRFGRRVQHLLNEPVRLPRFQVAHRAFQPHDVVANSGTWRPANFSRLPARRHLALPGAVDVSRFASPAGAARTAPPWRIGGYTAKNPGPLLEAVEYLARPADFELHWFGLPLVPDARLDRARRRLRVVEHGPLFQADLVRFYHQCDLFVTTETCAGWCNSAAEAAAAARATIVTPHGTAEFAHHGDTAWVLDEPEPRAIAAAITHLAADAALRNRLGRAAAETMRAFTWEQYADRLLEFVARPSQTASTEAPFEPFVTPARSAVHAMTLPLAPRKVA